MNRFAQVLTLGALCVAGTSAFAAPIYTNDFTTAATGFTGATTVITTSPSGEKFLEFGGGGSNTTPSGVLTLTGLATHTSVQLSFDLYVVGSMDGSNNIVGGGGGDYFAVAYSGTTSGTVFNQAFANYGASETQSYPTPGSPPGTGSFSQNALGYTGYPQSGTPSFQDTEYHFDLMAITDSSGTVSFTFTDGSNEGIANEFYGIDNVAVSLANDVTPPPPAGVPEPSTLAVLGIGLVALAAVHKKRAR